MARGIREFYDETLLPDAALPATSLLKTDRQKAARLSASQKEDSGRVTRQAYPRGIYSEFPSVTPKWHGRGGGQSDFRETMARMFILLGAGEKKRFLHSVDHSAHDNGESHTLASVLAGESDTGGLGYIDFLLQQVQHAFEEKSQIIETLADNYTIYYFGQAAVPFTYSGVVMNTFEDDQGINMLRLYQHVIRGTQLARRRKLLRIRYNGMIVSGSVMGLHLGLAAESETSMSFSLQLLPKSIELLPNPDFGVVMVDDVLPITQGAYTKEPTRVTAQRLAPAPPPRATLSLTAPRARLDRVTGRLIEGGTEEETEG